MDSYEATRIVFTKIQTLDPEHASKIMGLLLIQDHGEKGMIRLAFGPESLLHSIIIKARKQLGISSTAPFSSHNLFPNSASSRLINDGITNLPSPLSMTNSNYGSRQIYLTFPAESSFTEENVSKYFSIYGPVQDVRIPYQQKRMFGFVSFVYAETVKLVLAKGNPHFVCEARVLVKPYKEKGKVPDRFPKQPQLQMDGPIGYDPFDLQHGTRMLFNIQDLLWRKKLEEQADLQHAIELQSRRIIDLQLLDVKRNHHYQRVLSIGAVIPSPTCYSPSYLNRSSVFAYDSHNSSSPDSEDGLISNFVFPVTINGDEPPLKASLNVEKEKEASDFKDENRNRKSSPRHEDDIIFPESLEHNLPDSLFASPTKSGDHETVFSNDKNTLVYSTTGNNNLITSPLTSTLDMASLKSCYFQIPRFSSDNGAIGM